MNLSRVCGFLSLPHKGDFFASKIDWPKRYFHKIFHQNSDVVENKKDI